MPTAFIAVVFGFLGLMAAWGIQSALKTGTTSSLSGWTFRIDESPVGFWMMVLFKVCVIAFGIAELLHALDLVGDPFIAIHDILPFNAHP